MKKGDMAGEKKQERRIAAISLFLLALADFIVRLFRNSTGTLGEALSATFQVPRSSLGILTSLYFFPYMLMQIPTGYLADVLGIRIVVSLGMAATAIGGFLFGTAKNLTMLYIARVIIGFGVSAPVVCIQRFISAWYDQRSQGKVSGLQSLLGSLGSVFAQAPMAFLVHAITWRMTIIAVSVFAAVLSLTSFLLIRNTPEEWRGIVSERSAGKQGRPDKGLVRTFSSIYRNRYMWPLLVILFIHMSVNAVFASTYAVPYLAETFGYTNLQASSYTTVQAVGQMLGGIIAGPISDQIASRRKVMIVLSGLSALTWVLFVSGTAVLRVPAVLMIVMFINGLVYYQTVMVFFCAKEVNDPRYTGSSVSAVNMVGMLGSTVAPRLAASLMDAYAASGIAGAGLYQNTFRVFMGAALIMFGLTFTIRETHCRNIYQELFPANAGQTE